MTFTAAINSIRPGDAIRRPSWRGYVYKEFPAGEETSRSEKCDVIIVSKDGSKSVYPIGTESALKPTVLSPALLAGFMKDDWERGTVEAYERARVEGDF